MALSLASSVCTETGDSTSTGVSLRDFVAGTVVVGETGLGARVTSGAMWVALGLSGTLMGSEISTAGVEDRTGSFAGTAG